MLSRLIFIHRSNREDIEKSHSPECIERLQKQTINSEEKEELD